MYKKTLRFLAMRQNYGRWVDFWKKYTVLPSNQNNQAHHGSVGFVMGIPRVGNFNTVPAPVYTIPVQPWCFTKPTVSSVPAGYWHKNTTMRLQVAYYYPWHIDYSMTSTSESDSSRFLLEFPFTAARTSSKKMRSQRPQEPRQRNARIDEALRQLRVKDKSWRPCENTRSTAVDVAIGGKVN